MCVRLVSLRLSHPNPKNLLRYRCFGMTMQSPHIHLCRIRSCSCIPITFHTSSQDPYSPTFKSAGTPLKPPIMYGKSSCGQDIYESVLYKIFHWEGWLVAEEHKSPTSRTSFRLVEIGRVCVDPQVHFAANVTDLCGCVRCSVVHEVFYSFLQGFVRVYQLWIQLVGSLC